jgi:hypothetical protein
MKKLITVLSILTLIACSDNVNVTHQTNDIGQFTTGGSTFATTISTIIIDSCEYIGYMVGSNSDVLTHKGNCRFCEARKNKK